LYLPISSSFNANHETATPSEQRETDAPEDETYACRNQHVFLYTLRYTIRFPNARYKGVFVFDRILLSRDTILIGRSGFDPILLSRDTIVGFLARFGA
jgi:hypothetical protein